ncbi:MAG: hypothetical protein JXR73_19955 [Candidatus Omnitrophica bacterium]|nr:hypothetical protein [Candidatus Omnitrophota bacterium]
MGKYNVTYKCGHECEIELFGKTDDRRAKIEWMQDNQVGPTCYRAQQTERIAAADAAENLPELTGSEKQIAWALKIRREKIDDFKKQTAKVTDPKIKEIIEWLSGHAEAKFWIDHRFDTFQDFGRLGMEELGFAK